MTRLKVQHVPEESLLLNGKVQSHTQVNAPANCKASAPPNQKHSARLAGGSTHVKAQHMDSRAGGGGRGMCHRSYVEFVS